MPSFTIFHTHFHLFPSGQASSIEHSITRVSELPLEWQTYGSESDDLPQISCSFPKTHDIIDFERP